MNLIKRKQVYPESMQLANITTLWKNKGSKNLEDKINKLGKIILKKTLSEFKFYLNKI